MEMYRSGRNENDSKSGRSAPPAQEFKSLHLRQGSLEAFAPKEFFFLAERQTDCRSTSLFTLAIYMAIDICCGRHVTVT